MIFQKAFLKGYTRIVIFLKIHLITSFFNYTSRFINQKRLKFTDQLQKQSKAGCADRAVERKDTNNQSQAAK